MEILRFNKDNYKDYKNFINKYNNSIEFVTLKINNFDIGQKEIFLVIKKSLINKYKILAYSIVEKDLKYLYIANSISESYNNDGTYIFISDFMVKVKARNKGIGTKLAEYLIYETFKDKKILLQPDEDGYWFWKKFNFKKDNISEKETWIRVKRELEKL